MSKQTALGDGVIADYLNVLKRNHMYPVWTAVEGVEKRRQRPECEDKGGAGS